MYHRCRLPGVAFAGLALLACVGGCGGERKITISGQLVQKGQPINVKALGKAKGPSAPPMVVFIPVEDKGSRPARYPAKKLNVETATYEVELPPGQYRVTVYVPGISSPTAPPPVKGGGGKVYDLQEAQTLDLEVK
jgi:hypothetical protein